MPIASGLAVMSDTPPGVNGTTMVIGRSGYVCAGAPAAAASRVMESAERIQAESFIRIFLVGGWSRMTSKVFRRTERLRETAKLAHHVLKS